VIALTLPHNAASRRVMEKAAFAYEADVLHAGLAHVRYRRSSGRR
jgi:RimJ/RimL family protein N-acetyltransferase